MAPCAIGLPTSAGRQTDRQRCTYDECMYVEVHRRICMYMGSKSYCQTGSRKLCATLAPKPMTGRSLTAVWR